MSTAGQTWCWDVESCPESLTPFSGKLVIPAIEQGDRGAARRLGLDHLSLQLRSNDGYLYRPVHADPWNQDVWDFSSTWKSLRSAFRLWSTTRSWQAGKWNAVDDELLEQASAEAVIQRSPTRGPVEDAGKLLEPFQRACEQAHGVIVQLRRLDWLSAALIQQLRLLLWQNHVALVDHEKGTVVETEVTQPTDIQLLRRVVSGGSRVDAQINRFLWYSAELSAKALRQSSEQVPISYSDLTNWLGQVSEPRAQTGKASAAVPSDEEHTRMVWRQFLQREGDQAWPLYEVSATPWKLDPSFPVHIIHGFLKWIERGRADEMQPPAPERLSEMRHHILATLTRCMGNLAASRIRPLWQQAEQVLEAAATHQRLWMFAKGRLRRMCIEAGRTLVSRGKLASQSDIFRLSPEKVIQKLSGCQTASAVSGRS